ncbi:MAG: hypothetical protein GY832_03995 [Chloroflexi bacterium]|nr:hypothetical protein [Chloroflexota bacterium]
MNKIYTIALVLLTVLTLLSLTLNGVIIFGLMQAQEIAMDVRQTALNTVDDARSIVSGVGDDTFAYTLEVEQIIPIEASVPFDEVVVIPVNTVIPIDTTVIVPIDLGITTYDLDVPIQTIVPVDLEFAVPISQTVDIATTVLLDVDVPIAIPLNETPLVDYMDELDAGLGRLKVDLEQLEEKLALPFGIGED